MSFYQTSPLILADFNINHNITPISIKVKMLTDLHIQIEAIDFDNYLRWRSDFDKGFFSTFAQSNGKVCDLAIIWNSVKAFFSNQVNTQQLKLLTQSEIRSIDQSNASSSIGEQRIMYLLLKISHDSLLEYTIPFMLREAPFTHDDLLTFLRQCKLNQMNQKMENQNVQNQIFELNKSFQSERDELISEINKLKQENDVLQQEIVDRDEIIKAQKREIDKMMKSNSTTSRLFNSNTSKIKAGTKQSPRMNRNNSPARLATARRAPVRTAVQPSRNSINRSRNSSVGSAGNVSRGSSVRSVGSRRSSSSNGSFSSASRGKNGSLTGYFSSSLNRNRRSASPRPSSSSLRLDSPRGTRTSKLRQNSQIRNSSPARKFSPKNSFSSRQFSRYV